MEEKWSAIAGYEGLYEVSNMGRVRRVAYEIAPVSAGGYMRLRLFGPKGGKRFSVHALVAKAFLGEKPTPLHEVNHKNGNPADNRVDNLEYVTKAENIRHSIYVLRNPLPPSRERHSSITHPETFPKGERHGNAKLTAGDINCIRRLYKEGGHSQPALARRFNVSQKVIWQILNGKTWKHVQ